MSDHEPSGHMIPVTDASHLKPGQLRRIAHPTLTTGASAMERVGTSYTSSAETFSDGEEMASSRRNFLAMVGAGVVAAAVDVGGLISLSSSPAFAAATDTPARGLLGGLTTLDQIVRKGIPAAGGGYMPIAAGPGERHTLRNDLAISKGYRHPTLSLAAFAQMTDLHIVDDQSPLRVEFTDRFADLPNTQQYQTDSAYRPNEFLSTHIVDAMARAIRNVGHGPMTGLPLAFTIVTGDAVDNVQFNETRWYIDLLDGGQDIRADSGHIGVEESVSFHFAGDGSATHDREYWFPEAHGEGLNPIDNYQANYGFPFITGLLAAARRPYKSTGLGMPWYAAMGNHDGEIQGNLPAFPGGISGCLLPDMNAWAVGAFKPFGTQAPLPPNPGATDALDFVNGLVGRNVTADDNRHLLDRTAFAKEHFKTAGLPRGHGFKDTGGVDATYYKIPSGGADLIQYITLDTCNYGGHAGGSISIPQFGWLEDQLTANSSRFYRPDGSTVFQSGVVDKLFVIFCHHTIATMNNTSGDFGYLGDDLKLLLLRFPNVILMVNGHTHANIIKAHHRAEVLAGTVGGFWEVNTASHIDWPSQSRIVEIAAGDDVISIFTTIVDIDAPVMYGNDLSNPKALASLARQLSANDPTERPQARSGTLSDRNTQLLVQAPFLPPAPEEWGSSAALARNSNGTLELFGIQPDDSVWRIAQNAPGASPATDVWSTWTKFDDTKMRAVAAESNADGTLELVGVSALGEVWHRRHFSTFGWASWSSLQNSGARSIAMARNDVGGLEIFATISTGGVSHNRQLAANGASWTGWTFDVTNPQAHMVKVAAETNQDGRIELFGVASDGGIWHRANTLDGGWVPAVPWVAFSDGPVATAIAVAKNADGRLQLYVIDSDWTIWTRAQVSANSTNYTSWSQQSGRMTQLAAETNLDGRIELFGVDAAGQVWHTAQSSVSTTFTGLGQWRKFSGTLRPDAPVPPAGSTIGTPPPLPVTVPDVLGFDRLSAEGAIRAAGLTVGIESFDNTCQDVAGIILLQSPSRGTVAPTGSAVNLTLSSGVDSHGNACVLK
jgi:metallophosphoesterase (TIGR03767 family)